MGNLIVADYGNHCIRRVTPGSPSPGNPHAKGFVETIAGSQLGGEAAKGFADGDGPVARFHNSP